MLLIAIAPLPSHAQLTEVELDSITVLADRALAVPLSKLASDYSREHGVTITVGYAPSFEQTVAIKDGDSADLFISAHPKSLEYLKQYGLFDRQSLKPLLRANLSLVYSKGANELPSGLSAATYLKEHAKSYVAIASPAATAEGYYAEHALKSFGKLSLPTAEIPDTESILHMLDKAESSYYALMFEPDALLNTPDNIIATIERDNYGAAIFNSAIVPGDNSELAMQFQNYLASAEAQRRFIKYRFYPAE